LWSSCAMSSGYAFWSTSAPWAAPRADAAGAAASSAAPSQDSAIVREVDPVGVEVTQTREAQIGLGGRERSCVLRGLADDQHQTVAGPDRHRLVSRGMAGRREHADTVGYLGIAVDDAVRRARKIDPVLDRFALAARGDQHHVIARPDREP